MSKPVEVTVRDLEEQMMNLIFPIIIVALTTIFSGLVNITFGQESETSQTYQNPDIGIKFQYPSDWGKIVEKGENCPKSCVLVLERSSNTYPFNFVILAQSKESCNCNSLTDFVKYVYMCQQ